MKSVYARWGADARQGIDERRRREVGSPCQSSYPWRGEITMRMKGHGVDVMGGVGRKDEPRT